MTYAAPRTSRAVPAPPLKPSSDWSHAMSPTAPMTGAGSTTTRAAVPGGRAVPTRDVGLAASATVTGRATTSARRFIPLGYTANPTL